MDSPRVQRWETLTKRQFDAIDRERHDVIPAPLDVPWEGEQGGPVDALDDAGEALALPFDHEDILGMAVKRIRGKLDYTPIGFQLLKSWLLWIVPEKNATF